MKTVGIIVARFQVAELHEGHKYLIDHAREMTDRIIIFLGCPQYSNYFTSKDPLPYEHRKGMILEDYPGPGISIKPLFDVNADSVWVELLDEQINGWTSPSEKPILYGSRDSFIRTYSKWGGKYSTTEINPKGEFSGTKQREEIKNTFHNSVDFRKGIIYTSLTDKTIK